MFTIYLKNLKNHLFEFSKIYKINIFLTKFKSKFKNKFLNTSTVFNIKKKILTQTIMQKKILKRARSVDDNKNDNKKILINSKIKN